MLTEAKKQNVISRKSLRTFIGKCMTVASVIFVWRPFIQEMYTALHAEQTHAPHNCAWARQIKHSVEWLLQFLRGEAAGVRRLFTLEAYARTGPIATVTWDSSPYGMGATLEVEGRIQEFFAIPIGAEDQEVLHCEAGTHLGQRQRAWEALCGLAETLASA